MIFSDGISLAILGIVGGILILTGWVHQIIKGYRTKSLKDVSKYLMILIGVGAVLWTAYGLATSDLYIIGTNIAAIILMTIIFIMKSRYKRQEKKESKS